GRPILFYGLSPGADVRGTNLRPAGLKTRFEVARRDSAPLDVQLNLPGTHNVANALAAIAVTTELGIDDRAILNALATFQGIDRRLQHIADVPTAVGRVTIVDDYAHHPTELAVALKDVISDGDVILAMGAGNISAVAHALPGALAALLPPGSSR